MADQSMTLAEAGRRMTGRFPGKCRSCFCCMSQLCEHATANGGACLDFVDPASETDVSRCRCAPAGSASQEGGNR